jgi:hypothetical protein
MIRSYVRFLTYIYTQRSERQVLYLQCTNDKACARLVSSDVSLKCYAEAVSKLLIP